MSERPANPLVVAVDLSDLARADELARRLGGRVAMLKVGLELFTAVGPAALMTVRPHVPVFLDLKLHDIPNTVRRAARNAGRLGASMLTVHALGGPEMVRAAVDGAAQGATDRGVERPSVIAVTVLSSLAEQAGASPASLAFEAVEAGAAGAVVSGDDVRVVREALGEEPLLVVPGIRPAGHSGNDHARVLTPAEALEAGADYLVVGRPVTEASDPAAAADAILRGVGR
ncbi:MAG TPA: orotidine-5'-phosphate decarboxylase [Actinomycetota bacterium]|nr:orotidine-5'-phosphate decarboxylase [Actinomycetota bacterium]